MSDPITRALEDVVDRFRTDRTGDIATYIPELSRVEPDLFGVSLASMSGVVYAAGDADHSFTLQSVSKPFVYALALTEFGLEATLDRVGAEPSGEAFNAISLDPASGRPANPMINAGAIVTTSLISGADPGARFERIRAGLSAFAGRELEFDEAVYRSESETGDRNRALAYLMHGAGSLTAPVEEAVDCYFRQCALLATARDIAIMSATLANGGRNPVTGQRVVSAEVAAQVLAIMTSCGMYDASGRWMLRVGLPAKSGVAGGVIAVSPGEFGIGLFSPRLDEQGNSVRGVAACRDLSERFDLHLMNGFGRQVPVVLSIASADQLLGTDEPRLVRKLVVTLQGDITFACAERTLHEIQVKGGDYDEVLLDLTRVGNVNRAGAGMFQGLANDLRAQNRKLVIIDPAQRRDLVDTPMYADLPSALVADQAA